MSGSNPMRWDCEKQGCFNKLKRPKIEQFSDCFPGRINFGDVDGIVEIAGRALLLEWKPGKDALRTGQRIMYERLTRDKLLSVILVCGNAETMEISSFAQFCSGKQRPWKDGSMDDVKKWIRAWVAWAQKHSIAPIR